MITGVHYVSFANRSGYGTAAARAIRGLLDAGVAVRWTPLRWTDAGGEVDPEPTVPPDLLALHDAPVTCDAAVIHTPPGSWAHLRPLTGALPTVGVTVWETTVVPPTWAAWCDLVDAVVVPCSWNIEVFRAGGVGAPLHVVPHCPPPPLAGDRGPDLVAPFTFTTIGEWTVRKAMPDTIEAFLTAFAADDPVRLVVKTGVRDETGLSPPGGGAVSGTTTWALTSLLRRHPAPPPVQLVTRELDDEEMAELHRATDCYVSLAHAEGFGLGAHEAASHGRPVVATGWSGWLDHLEDGALLVDHKLVPVDDPTGAQASTPGQRWARADVAHGAALLRSVVADPEAARARGARLREAIRRTASAGECTRRLLDVLAGVTPGARQ